MRRNNILLGWALLCACTVVSSTAKAADVTPTKNNGEFIAGDGIPSNDFTIDTASSGESVALKGRLRDTGQSLETIGNNYFVSSGLASDNINPSWAFDWQFSPGDQGMEASDYFMTIEVDFDPSPATDYATIAAPIGDPDNDPFNSWDDTDGFFLNPGGGAWSDDNVPFVYSQSWNLGFDFWTLPPFNKTYNPNINGIYNINLFVNKTSSPDPIARSSIVVNVIPEPTTLSLLAIIGLCGLGARRRR